MNLIDTDRFPCDVEFPDKKYQHQDEFVSIEGARVVLHENHVLIAIDAENGPQVIFFEKYDISDISKHPEENSTIYTKSGKMIVFRENRTCGCGSRLRGWNPYKTLKRLKD